MKKYLITLAALLFCMSYAVMAEKRPVDVKHTPPINPNGLFESPSVSGEYDEAELTLTILNFNGVACVTIVDSFTNQTVLTDNEIIWGSSTFDINISALPSGTYTLYIVLNSGDSFYATINL